MPRVVKKRVDQLPSGSSPVKTGRETKLKVVVWGIIMAFMFTTAAAAQEDTESASFLMPYCKLAPAQAGNKAFLAGRCAGLIQGIADTLALVKGADGNKLTPLCMDRPKGANADQAIKVVTRYGDAHPDQLHAPFTVIAALALTEAWPCRK
jgi:hypothetical protein